MLLTPHAQCERGKVIGIGVHIYNVYICSWTKKIESYFSDRLTTLSKIRDRTSHESYRLALPLLSPETLSSSSKSRISLFNVYHALFVRRMTQLRSG